MLLISGTAKQFIVGEQNNGLNSLWTSLHPFLVICIGLNLLQTYTIRMQIAFVSNMVYLKS